MLTIIESPLFSKLWPDYWSEEERGEFVAYLAMVLLIIYSKGGQENVPAHILRELAEEMGYGQE